MVLSAADRMSTMDDLPMRLTPPTATSARRAHLPPPRPSPEARNRHPRPALRILTDPVTLSAIRETQAPSHYAAPSKSAPLATLPSVNESRAGVEGSDQLRKLGGSDLAQPPPVLPSLAQSRLSVRSTRRLEHQRHNRRLSDRIKALFVSLHPINGFRHQKHRSSTLSNENEEASHKSKHLDRPIPPVRPTRPHRSPGTASFLVTRHLDAPTLEISHFSGPSTLASSNGRGGASTSGPLSGGESGKASGEWAAGIVAAGLSARAEQAVALSAGATIPLRRTKSLTSASAVGD